MSGGTLVRQRLAWERDFTQIPNVYVRDRTLSFVARGILAWLMTHSDGHQVSMREIEAASWKEGREAVRSAVGELERGGYLHRQEKRGRGGRLSGYTWHLTDPFQLPVMGAPQLPIGALMAVDNSASPGTGSRHPVGDNSSPADGLPSTATRPPIRTLDKEHSMPSATTERPGQPVDNFGAVRWSDDRCPGNYRDGRHELGKHGTCTWCYDRPIVRSMP